MNLGLESQAQTLITEANTKSYDLNDEEKKVNIEKIKALRDPNDDLKTNNIPFNEVEEGAPLVLEQIRIHESWLLLAEEHMRWGSYVKAKDLLKEVNLHARILKDQPSYAKSLLQLSTVAYLEGESGSALKLDMMCHNYAQDMEFIEKAIIHTNDLLINFDKIEDCKILLDGSIDMLTEIKINLTTSKVNSETKKSQSSISP